MVMTQQILQSHFLFSQKATAWRREKPALAAHSGTNSYSKSSTASTFTLECWCPSIFHFGCDLRTSIKITVSMILIGNGYRSSMERNLHMQSHKLKLTCKKWQFILKYYTQCSSWGMLKKATVHQPNIVISYPELKNWAHVSSLAQKMSSSEARRLPPMCNTWILNWLIKLTDDRLATVIVRMCHQRLSYLHADNHIWLVKTFCLTTRKKKKKKQQPKFQNAWLPQLLAWRPQDRLPKYDRKKCNKCVSKVWQSTMWRTLTPWFRRVYLEILLWRRFLLPCMMFFWHCHLLLIAWDLFYLFTSISLSTEAVLAMYNHQKRTKYFDKGSMYSMSIDLQVSHVLHLQ